MVAKCTFRKLYLFSVCFFLESSKNNLFKSHNFSKSYLTSRTMKHIISLFWFLLRILFSMQQMWYAINFQFFTSIRQHFMRFLSIPWRLTVIKISREDVMPRNYFICYSVEILMRNKIETITRNFPSSNLCFSIILTLDAL